MTVTPVLSIFAQLIFDIFLEIIARVGSGQRKKIRFPAENPIKSRAGINFTLLLNLPQTWKCDLAQKLIERVRYD